MASGFSVVLFLRNIRRIAARFDQSRVGFYLNSVLRISVDVRGLRGVYSYPHSFSFYVTFGNAPRVIHNLVYNGSNS